MRFLRFGVTFKLFLAILATCIVVTLAMGAAVRLSFDWGFRHYVQQRESRQADTLTNMLADYYQEAGSWDDLRDQPRRWWRVLRSNPDTRSAQTPERYPTRTAGHTLNLPYYLLDQHENIVVGAPSGTRTQTDDPRYPILVEGHTVGWLVSIARRQIPNVIDQRFIAQQVKATWIIVALSVLIAALVSVLLARGLIAPLRRLGQATHRLSGGDYSTRVQAHAQDELGQLARDFNHLALTLERNERMRRDMVADISHELRTPLAILQGELEAMQDGVRPLTPDALVSLQAEVTHLKKLIDDLYQLSLADVGAMHYRMVEVDIASLLRNVCDQYRKRLATRHLQLTLNIPDTPLLIQGDPQRLTQLFNNLLENSLRYTDPNGQVRVTLSSQAQTLDITIDDTSPGVPPALLPRLFERMFRVDASRSRESGGSGLGLALAAHIAEAHQATIQALPSSLGGVCIALRFTRTPT